MAGGMARNVPIPAGMNDDEMRFVLFEYLLPLAADFGPQAVVLQCGCDALAEDPQSRQMLGNRSVWEVVREFAKIAPRLMVLGGGGYNPYGVARCWAGIWATVNNNEIPEKLPESAEEILRDIKWSHRLGRQPAANLLTTLADDWRGGEIRAEVRGHVQFLKGYGV
jgi:acetoin utilization protein AcuC